MAPSWRELDAKQTEGVKHPLPSSSAVAFLTAVGAPARVFKNGTDKYLWNYNSTGMPYKHTDIDNDRVYTYDYDSLGRVVRQFGNTKSTGENRFMSQYTYDVSNNVTKVVNFADGNKVTTRHTYDGENRPTKTTINSNVNYTYTYDELGRLKNYYLNLGATKLLIEPEYYASERNTDNKDTYQTTQIHLEKIGDRAYMYTYDNVGNIETVTEKKNATAEYTDKVSYEYDDLGQLTRENNVDLNQTIVYTYDNGGNIKSKKIYAYTTGTLGAVQETINYTYDSPWKDKLTNYNGTTITYDEIGNPEDYRDNMSFTWNGRQMATANLNGTAVTYKYDADGLRSYKKVGNTVHEYEYVGGQLVYEKRGDLKFYYRYNAMGELASIKRVNSSGTEYTVYVVTNTRGDVEELWLASGTRVARYVYDTWGNTIGILDDEGDPITDTSSIAVQNPFRYRSYYYDAESGLYYLQSRYYDPVTCRFLNADALLNTENVLGFNLFVYCINNPVIYVDYTGERYFECCPYGCANCRSSKSKSKTTVYTGKIDYEAYDEKYGDQPRYDRSVNGDRQKTVRKQVNSAWGNDKANREKNSTDHHKHKKKTGRGGSDNVPFSDLKSGDYKEFAVIGTGIAIIWVLANNSTGVGVADDLALGPLIRIFLEGAKSYA